MSYTDGFIVAVPKANKEKYIEFAKLAAVIFKDHGALSIVENWQDDVSKGKVTDFFRAVDAKDDEAIVFSWVTWPSKDARTQGWEKVMSDPRMQEQSSDDMPFDGKRIVYGGFENVLDM